MNRPSLEQRRELRVAAATDDSAALNVDSSLLKHVAVANDEEAGESADRLAPSTATTAGAATDLMSDDIDFTFNTTRERTYMKILVINNDGGGFADYVDVADGVRPSPNCSSVRSAPPSRVTI